MSDRPSVLVTNDDGIDCTGLHVLVDALKPIAAVTVVAPTEDQSGTGRTNSYRVAVDEYEHGFAVDGKPADCVAVGLRGLDVDVDLVVSGINPGPNIGWQTVGRSGTVGAAAEAAFLGVPAMAVSLYDPEVGIREFDREEFEPAADLAADLLSAIREGVPGGDYLNVVAPAGGGEIVATDQSSGYDVQAVWDGQHVDFENALYDPILPGNEQTPNPEPTSPPVPRRRRASRPCGCSRSVATGPHSRRLYPTCWRQPTPGSSRDKPRARERPV